MLRDSVEVVQNSISVMIRLMEQIHTNDVKNYYFDGDNYFYVANQKLVETTPGSNVDSLIYHDVFRNFTRNEIEEFLNIAFFLKENYISSAYLDKVFNIYLFDYRSTPANDYNDLRYIFLLDGPVGDLTTSEKESWQLLDKQEKLLLIAPSDAVIK